MPAPNAQQLLSLDAIAFAWLVLCWVGYSLVTSRTPWGRAGFVAEMTEQRRLWMKEMAMRELRMVDAQLLAAIASGNAFFASTSVFVIAGLVATLGSIGPVSELLASIPFLSNVTRLELELKTALMIAIYIYAFFKFAWAYRLSLATGILIGATPEYTPKNAKRCFAHGVRAGELAVLLAKHGTAGLRAFYFGMSILSWFIHPLAFMATVLLVVLVLYRREYQSNALAALRNDTD